MSNVYLTAAWAVTDQQGQQLQPRYKLLLVCLADMADTRGKCWPAVPTVARRIGYSDRQVQRMLQQLESLGLICRQRRKGKSDYYYLQLPVAQTGDTVMSPLSPSTGDTVLSPPVVTQLCQGSGDTAMSPKPKRTQNRTQTSPHSPPEGGGEIRLRRERRARGRSKADNFSGDYSNIGRIWKPAATQPPSQAVAEPLTETTTPARSGQLERITL